jgi:hypothetical protein
MSQFSLVFGEGPHHITQATGLGYRVTLCGYMYYLHTAVIEFER